MNSYEWVEVADAAKRIFKKMHPRMHEIMDNPLVEIYNNNLPFFVEKIFIKAFVDEFDKNENDMKILIQAYKDLSVNGSIGK